MAFVNEYKNMNMKNYIIILLVLFAANVAKAQASFESFESNEKVSAVVVNKKMFELMSKIKVDAKDVNAQNYLALIKSLDHLRVLSTSDASTSKLLIITTHNYLSQNPLEELLQSISNGKSVKIYTKPIGNSDKISELLMLVEDQQSKNNVTIMTLLGNFSVSSLAILTEKMDLPGSKEIKDLSKK
jgi:hypothetical protein